MIRALTIAELANVAVYLHLQKNFVFVGDN